MKIIQFFKDYYDFMMSFDTDSSYTWIRKKEAYSVAMKRELRRDFYHATYEEKLYARVKCLLNAIEKAEMDIHQQITLKIQLAEASGNPHVNEQEIPCSHFLKSVYPKYDRNYHGLINSKATSTTGYIFFCGKLIPFLGLANNRDDFESLPKPADTFAFTYEQFAQSQNYDEIMENIYSESVFVRKKATEASMKSFFSLNPSKQLVAAASEISFKFNTPIFALGHNGDNITLIVNPSLKDLGLASLIPAQECYTELEMFISGVLSIAHKNTIELDDKTRIQKHGFDLKTSFRN